MLSPITEILDELRAGRMVVLIDDASRENEGDLVLAAQHATPDAVNFMLREARGYLCLSLTSVACDRLGLHPQTAFNTSQHTTALTVAIDAHPKHGVTTGVSAWDRSKTIEVALAPCSRAEDLVRPGHLNPLRARDGGVLVRAGQTEGSVDLCRLAGLDPSAVIIEIMRPDGAMARVPDLESMCERLDLKMCSVEQIIEYRLAQEPVVTRGQPALGSLLRTRHGDFQLFLYESVVDAQPHVALTLGAGAGGRFDPTEPTLVRMHRRDVLGDVFGAQGPSHAGSTGDALHASLSAVQRAGRGAVVYLRTEGSPDDPDTTLSQRLQSIRRGAANPDDPGVSTPPSDAAQRRKRELGVGCQILRDLGVGKIRLLTDHPRALSGIDAYGLEIVEHVGLTPACASAADPG